MAMARIKVKSDALEQTIRKFNACKDALADAYRQMKNAVNQVDASWQGDASQKFIAKFNEIYANLQTSDATVQQAVDGLQIALDQYTEVENMVIDLFGQVEEAANPFA